MIHTIYSTFNPADTLRLRLRIVDIYAGESLSRAERRQIDAGGKALVSFEDDPIGIAISRGPYAFHETTRRWAIRRADILAVWAGPPNPVSAGLLSPPVEEGSKSVAVAMTRAEHCEAWLAEFRCFKRPTATVHRVDEVSGVLHAA